MQFQTPAISYYFDKEYNNRRRRPSGFNTVKFL